MKTNINRGPCAVPPSVPPTFSFFSQPHHFPHPRSLYVLERRLYQVLYVRRHNGELNLQGLGPMGMAATSTQSPRTCPPIGRRKQSHTLVAGNRSTRQPLSSGGASPNPDRFDIWLVTHPACPPQRKIYYGTWKYARHCLLDPTGHHNACTQVPQTLIIQLRKS
ncbi:hypothetical protein B0H10DRAFT_2235680 [Mycena sp. CBHHK59/15]|nr:hypothetical protein B0H10DRAFT_2235680 [Mycena sp. CBHHK59/15]